MRDHKQLLIVTLEFSENSGCRGQPKAEGLRGERESTFGQLWLSSAWQMWWSFLKGVWGWEAELLFTSSMGLLHVISVANEGFLCPFGLATWVKGRSEACMVYLSVFLGEAMCVVCWAEPFLRAGMVEWVLPAGQRDVLESGCSSMNQWLCVAMSFVSPLWQAPLLEELWDSHITDINRVNTNNFSPYSLLYFHLLVMASDKSLPKCLLGFCLKKEVEWRVGQETFALGDAK